MCFTQRFFWSAKALGIQTTSWTRRPSYGGQPWRSPRRAPVANCFELLRPGDKTACGVPSCAARRPAAEAASIGDRSG